MVNGLLKFVSLYLFIAVIVTDKANILLRYLHQQWEVKVRLLSLAIIYYFKSCILELVLKVDVIYQTLDCVSSGYPNTEKVENAMCRGRVFFPKFEVFSVYIIIFSIKTKTNL